MIKIFGIDPALGSLGWGVITSENSKINYIASGVIKTKPSCEMHLRLADISNKIELLINEHQPNAIVMEETFVNKNPASSLKLGFVRGALMALIGRYNLPFYEYKPNKIKKSIVGVGHAEKEQVKHMVKLILCGVPDELSFDEADALAAAYTCLVNEREIIKRPIVQ